MNTPTPHGGRSRAVATGCIALVLASALGACGNSGTDATSEETSTTQARAAIAVTDPWARATPPGTQVGVVYAEIVNTGDADALVGATVPADVAAEVQIHVATTVAPGEGGTATSTTTEPGTGMEHSLGTGRPDAVLAHHTPEHQGDDAPAGTSTGMQQVSRLEIPAGGTLTLAPGGSHIMLVGLAKPLVAGQAFPVTLQFEKAPQQTISVEVRDS